MSQAILTKSSITTKTAATISVLALAAVLAAGFVGSQLTSTTLKKPTKLVIGQATSKNLLASASQATSDNLNTLLPEILGDEMSLPPNFNIAQASFDTNKTATATTAYSIQASSDQPIYFAANPRNHFNAKQENNSFTINSSDSSKDWSVTFELQSIQKDKDANKALRPKDQAEAQKQEYRIERKHEGFKAEYKNTEKGWEDTYTVEKKPTGDDKLEVVLKVDKKNLLMEQKKDYFLFKNAATQEPVLQYGDLKATDAAGKLLSSTLTQKDDFIFLIIDDVNATYPIIVDPLAAAPGWTVYGEQEYSNFGYSTTASADVNGDEYDDIIIGAFRYDHDEGDEGKVYAFYGAAAPDTIADWTYEPNIEDRYFANYIFALGDINGDGYDEIGIESDQFSYEGGAYTYYYYFDIFYGSASGLNTTPGWSKAFGILDSMLEAQGADFNGDGYIDVLFWTQDQDPLLEDFQPLAYIYYGSSSGISPNPDWEQAELAATYYQSADMNGDGYSDILMFGGSSSTLYYGSVLGITNDNTIEIPSLTGNSALGGSGDINGDGYDDILITVTDGTPSLYMKAVYGSASGTVNESAWSIEITSSAHILSAGDINMDGFDDIMVGDASYDGLDTNTGKVEVYRGSAIEPDLTPYWIFEGTNYFDQVGISGDLGGDIDGDGTNDIVVGAHSYKVDGLSMGAVFMFRGEGPCQPTLASTWSAAGNQNSALLGWSTDSAGDVNGDGKDDVIVGAPLFDNGQVNEGIAVVHYGSDGLSITPDWFAEGNQKNLHFGYDVAGLGDVNGDGFADIAVSTPEYYEGSARHYGAVFIYKGSATGLVSTPSWTIYGNQEFAKFGASIAGDDVTADQLGDLLVGAPRYDNDETDEGAAFMYAGSVTGVTTTPTWSTESNQTDAWLGTSVAVVGDDVIIGAPRYDNGETDEGVALGYYSELGSLPAVYSWLAESNQANAKLGFSVASAGDVNADGFSDVIAGAPQYDNGEIDEGAAFVYHGSASGFMTTPNWSAESDQLFGWFGFSVAGLGRLSSDTDFDSVIVGSPLFTNGENFEGQATVYTATAGGLNTTAYWTTESNQANAGLGWSVASAGDYDGNGQDDLMIGTPLNDAGIYTNDGKAEVYTTSCL
ncbi:MAG: FG-GAP repeat protein [Candidatus Kerfeldbacteria bacterium]|nr:FG-GAP repeat protein [Candidatus Kerfeldbacteria bacterium]